jgi:NodT family efflux transporter outer membrane factor (OMF) lipoprotein
MSNAVRAGRRIAPRTSSSSGSRHRLTLAGVAALCCLLSGCTVGPDFISPGAPPVSGYLPQSRQPSHLGAQRLHMGADVSAEWWALLGSRGLNSLIQRGLAQNADIKAQEAAIRAAQAMALAQRGALFPTVDGNYNFTRQKVPTESQASNAATGASIYSVHTAQLTVGFVPDVFGGTRRLIEVANTRVEIEQIRRQAAILTVTASIALAAIQEASFREQIAVTRRLIEAQEQVLSLLKRQEGVGQIGLQDVVAQETAVAQAKLLLPPLERQMDQQRNLLAVLTGAFPSDYNFAEFNLKSFKLPRDLPVSLPADLVRQRPDILVAEAGVQVVNAQVGIAIANRLPQIKIAGTVGSAASAFSKLFAGGTGLWTIAGDVVQPIFDGMSLYYKQKAAEEALVQAVEQYRGVVLVAFQNVADTLVALDADSKAVTAAAAAERAAGRSIQLLRNQLEQGQISLPNLLVAQQAYLQTSLARVQAEASRLANTVVLFQALGGGWWKLEVAMAAAHAHDGKQ